MPQNQPQATPTTDDLIEQLESYIVDASQLLSQGQYVELLELEGRVSQLCTTMQQMPLAQAKPYLQQLEKIKAKLDLLHEAMNDHKAQLGEDIQGLDVQKRASHAYAKISTMRTTQEQ
jgi:hypothetical protein